MNCRKAKALRRAVTGDPDLKGRIYAKQDNQGTYLVHPQSERGQYKQAKKEERND